MAQIVTKAGAFELECWTDGAHLEVDDLHDLIHAVQRMIDKTTR